MPKQVRSNPTNVFGEARDGTPIDLRWNDRDNGKSLDGSYTYETANDSDPGLYLVGSNFGFNLPLDAIINGVEVEWQVAKDDGDVVVSGGPLPDNPLDVEFIKAKGSRPVSALTVVDNQLNNGATVSVSTVREGVAGSNSYFTINARAIFEDHGESSFHVEAVSEEGLATVTVGPFHLTGDGVTGEEIAQAIIDNVSAFQDGDIVGSGTAQYTDSENYSFAFLELAGNYASRTHPFYPTGAPLRLDLKAPDASGDLVIFTEAPLSEGDPGTNEIQRVSISGTPTAGSFQLDYETATTPEISFDSDAIAAQEALQSLSGFGSILTDSAVIAVVDAVEGEIVSEDKASGGPGIVGNPLPWPLLPGGPILFGDPNDEWGLGAENLTPENINNFDFRVKIAAIQFGSAMMQRFVDGVTVTVYYNTDQGISTSTSDSISVSDGGGGGDGGDGGGGASSTTLPPPEESVSEIVDPGPDCDTPVTIDPLGRVGIAVDQPQGGDDFPFVFPSADIQNLIGDAYLSYTDPNCELKLPFRIQWLYGFGCLDVSVPISPAHNREVLVVDDNDAVVFDSRDANDYREVPWGDHLLVLEWRTDDEILRIVQHVAWPHEDAVKDFPIYFEPEEAIFDDRVAQQTPPRLLSFRVGLETVEADDVVFRNGFNTELLAGETSRVDGEPAETEILFSAEPGSGEGRFGPPCDEELDQSIRTIAGSSANRRGNFILDAEGCYYLERPVHQVVSNPDDPREILVQHNRLRISNNCGPCCDCDDFVAVYEAIRRLRNRYTDLVARAQAVRDLYHANRERFLRQKRCREQEPLKLVSESYCPCRAGIAVGFCNNSEECLENLVLPLSFEYSGEGVSVTTSAPNPKIVPNSTFRGGFVQSGLTRSVGREQYALGGEYPHYWAYFPKVQPHAQAYVTFVIEFEQCRSSNQVQFITDAYGLDSIGSVSGDSPIPGYTPGTGPTTQAAKDARLVEAVRQGSASIVSECPD